MSVSIRSGHQLLSSWMAVCTYNIHSSRTFCRMLRTDLCTCRSVSHRSEACVKLWEPAIEWKVLEYNWQDTAGLWEWDGWIKDASHLKYGEVKIYLHHTVSVNLGTVLMPVLMPVSNTSMFCLVSTEYTYLVPKVWIHTCDYSSGKGAKLWKFHKKQQTLTGLKGILLSWM